MRFGSYSVFLPQGRESGESGYVHMFHGTVYQIKMGNHSNQKCDAVVMIDGKEVGVFRINQHSDFVLQRTAEDTGRFTFFRTGSEEAIKSDESSVSKNERGLIQVIFKPEKVVLQHSNPYLQRPMEYLRTCSTEGQYTNSTKVPTMSRGHGGADREVKTCGGITGLTGQSDQSFVKVSPLDYDASMEVTISLRLVESQLSEPRPIMAASRGNKIPDPVS